MNEEERNKILKDISDLKIKYWDLAENTPKLYRKKMEALGNYQQHIRDKNQTESMILELRRKKDV